jgi:hypothetical protein
MHHPHSFGHLPVPAWDHKDRKGRADHIHAWEKPFLGKLGPRYCGTSVGRTKWQGLLTVKTEGGNFNWTWTSSMKWIIHILWETVSQSNIRFSPSFLHSILREFHELGGWHREIDCIDGEGKN